MSDNELDGGLAALIVLSEPCIDLPVLAEALGTTELDLEKWLSSKECAAQLSRLRPVSNIGVLVQRMIDLRRLGVRCAKLRHA